MNVYRVILIILAFTLNSCINEWDKFLETEDIDYNIIQATESFKQNSKLYVELYKNNLTLRLHIKPLVESDTLLNVKLYKSFYFEFYNSANQVVKIDSSFAYHLYNSVMVKDNKLKYNSEGYDLLVTNDMKFTIPLIYFYKLKCGDNIVRLKVYSSDKALVKNHSKDIKSYKSYINDDFLGVVEFKINIPQIYKSTVCNDSIILQNDKDFSPVGMDVSLRDGLPDIYWRFIYHSDGKYYQGFHSPNEAIYDVMYTYKDTLSFYHFMNHEKISIEVMDRDDLSPDDIIGIWKGEVNDLKTSDSSYKRLSFKHIDLFKIKIVNENEKVN